MLGDSESVDSSRTVGLHRVFHVVVMTGCQARDDGRTWGRWHGGVAARRGGRPQCRTQMAGTGTLECKGVDVEAVIAGTPTSCKVAVEISNFSSRMLHAPVWYMESGTVEYSIPSEIFPNEKRACGFRKMKTGFFGCTGILIYRIKDSDKCLCLMFSNPFTMAFSRQFAISLQNWVPENTPARLYDEMMKRDSKNEGTTFVKSMARGSDLTAECSSTALKVKAKMLDESASIVWLKVMDLPVQAPQPAINSNDRFATRRLVDAETPLVFSSVLISLAQAVYPKMDKDSLDTLVLDHMLGLARDLDRVLPASDEDDLTSLKVARCLQAYLHIKRHLTVVACMGRHQQAGTVLARASAADDVVGTDPVKMVAAAEQGESYDDAWLDALCAESADLSEVQRSAWLPQSAPAPQVVSVALYSLRVFVLPPAIAVWSTRSSRASSAVQVASIALDARPASFSSAATASWAARSSRSPSATRVAPVASDSRHFPSSSAAISVSTLQQSQPLGSVVMPGLTARALAGLGAGSQVSRVIAVAIAACGPDGLERSPRCSWCLP
ncbi:unnamed protein product [Lampetra fluviatilis]